MFGPAATTQEFSRKLLKWQAYVRVDLTKCAKIKTQVVEAENLRVFVGMVKGKCKNTTIYLLLKISR